MEIWKDVPGFESIYQVSDIGRVKSLSRKDSLGRNVREKILKCPKNNSGYKTVSLHDKKNNKKEFISIHRLVADVFLCNEENLPCVNHKDNDKENNSVSNLEWCSYDYNNTYNGCDARAKDTMTKKYGKPIYVIFADGKKEIFGAVREACRVLNLDQSNVVRCLKERQNSYKGLKFEYVTGENNE